MLVRRAGTHFPGQRRAAAAELAFDLVALVAYAFLLVTTFLALFALVPGLAGFEPIVIRSGSMNPVIERGDVVLTRAVDASEIRPGDVVTAASPTRPDSLVSHRVMKVSDTGEITTKGDANPQPDSTPIRADDVVGVGRVLVPRVGTVTIWFSEHEWGRLVGFATAVAISALTVRRAGRHPGLGRRRRMIRRRVRPATVASAATLAALALLADGLGVLPAAPRSSAAAFTATTSNAANTLASATSLDDHSAAVLASTPQLYWRMNDASGSLRDLTGNGRPATVSGSGLTRSQTGALTGDSDTAIRFNGSTGCVVASTTDAGPQTMAWGMWIKTSTTSGGVLGQFTQDGTATSSGANFDRMLYMTDAGRLAFGVWNGTVTAVTSPSSYNNGQWHHVVATLGTTGIALYVDGAVVATNAANQAEAQASGYWKVGCGTKTSWPSTPTSAYLDATLDEVAVFPRPLTAGDVTRLYETGTRSSTRRAYAAAVLADTPAIYQRYGESSGTAADISGNGRTSTVSGSGVTRGYGGAIAQDASTAMRFDGSTGCTVTTATMPPPSAASIELWFRTSVGGGVLAQFSVDGTATSAGANRDRHIYMSSSGDVVFGVWNTTYRTVSATGPFNDGRWHQVVATIGAGGMAIYVDGTVRNTLANTGAENTTGYWKFGCGDVGGWPSAAAPTHFNGLLDEPAVYTSALSATQVRSHYDASILLRTALASNVVPGTPWMWWRLGGSSGTATDSSGNGRAGTVASTGVTRPATGAVTNDADTAFQFNGSTGQVVSTSTVTGPQVFTIEMFVKTSTSSGGVLAQFSDSTTMATGATFDRMIYMTNAGLLTFGVHDGGAGRTATSTRSYNDGSWHHVAATLDGDGMALYVDGAVVASATYNAAYPFTGSWRVGGGQLAGWPSAPSSNFLNGTVDEFAVYTSVLGAATINDHSNARDW